MARQKQVIEIEKVVCDVCGKKADGEWYMTANSTDTIYDGGVSGEYNCPLDLCRLHMSAYNHLVLNSIRYVNERHDGGSSSETKELLEKLDEVADKYRR